MPFGTNGGGRKPIEQTPRKDEFDGKFALMMGISLALCLMATAVLAVAIMYWP